jgi:hypothetical protein
VPRVASTTQLRIVTAPVLGTLQLDSLARVTGGVVLFDCAIPDLSGLHALANVGTFGISGAQRLRDVRGLSSLQQVRLLMLAGNPALLSLDGLESISTISATVSISDNPVLTSVAGLRNATSMGSLAISGNALLPRIELTSLVTIHHDLTIASNPAMTTLSGLDALTSVADTLVIEHNDRIPAEEVAAFRTRLGR